MAEETKKENKVFILKPYTTRELSRFYGISYSTMRLWLERIKEKVGEKTGHFFSIKQMEIIIEEFGLPKTISLE